MIDKTSLIEILQKVTAKTKDEGVSKKIENAILELDIKELKTIMISLYREVLSNMGHDPDEGMIDMFEAVDAHIEEETIIEMISEINHTFKQA